MGPSPGSLKNAWPVLVADCVFRLSVFLAISRRAGADIMVCIDGCVVAAAFLGQSVVCRLVKGLHVLALRSVYVDVPGGLRAPSWHSALFSYRLARRVAFLPFPCTCQCAIMFVFGGSSCRVSNLPGRPGRHDSRSQMRNISSVLRGAYCVRMGAMWSCSSLAFPSTARAV